MPSCKKKFIFIFFLFAHLFSEDYPKIGLVLSGGGSKGFAHIATLKALDSLNIPIDYIAGTSFGAIVGAMYSLGYSGKQIEEMAIETDWYEVQKDEPERKYLPHFRKKDTGKYQLEFGLDGFKPETPTGLIYGQKIILELSKWTREFEQIYDFDLLPIPFRCNAFDIISGKEVILKEGSLSHALRASLSIPTIFAPVEWGDALLVDGGVANNLPVDIVKEMGADIIIAVDVSATVRSKSSLNNMYDIVDQAISVHGYEKKFNSIQNADYYIRPEIGKVSFTDYRITTMKHLFKSGENAVKENWEKFLALKKITKDRGRKTLNIKPLKKPLIHDIKIKGQKSLSSQFIKSFIGLEKGMKLKPEVLDASISELYSLGYFKILYYEIHALNENEVNVIIHVEETQLRKFYLGLRWDNLYHLVGTANVQITSDLLPGIRIEDQIQFAGIKKNEFTISYPSRRLNFPIYPYFNITNSHYPFTYYKTDENNHGIPYDLYLNEIKTGLGVLLKNYWNGEIEYYLQKNTFESDLDNNDEDTSISGIRIKAQLDILDDVLLPKNGMYLKIILENSKTLLGSDINYQFYQAKGAAFKTFKRNTYGLSGYYHQGSNETPLYYTTLFDGNKAFIGLDEFQIHGSSIAFARLDYRYRYKKDILGHLMINWFVNAESENANLTAQNIWGLGTGITLLSPVGPLEFIWSWGPKDIYLDKDWKGRFHFSAGFKF